MEIDMKFLLTDVDNKEDKIEFDFQYDKPNSVFIVLTSSNGDDACNPDISIIEIKKEEFLKIFNHIKG